MHSFENGILEILKHKTGKNCLIESVSPLSGGDINHALFVKTSCGNFFSKWNYENMFPGMFEAEAKGLELLKSADEITIPTVTGFGTHGNISALVLEWIEKGTPSPNFYYEFGVSLAKMHSQSNELFGLDYNNYIGSLTQVNSQNHDWLEFFSTQRIEFQLRMAIDNKKIGDELIIKAEKLFSRLTDYFPVEAPSLLHGDLWGGNYLISRTGKPVLIDPAVYYGHRYMDLGMSRLFGGFNSEFYEGYSSEYKLYRGWEDSTEIANLYPLLVHVNLFGGGYSSTVKSIFNRYV